jgi:hypothetical protein
VPLLIVMTAFVREAVEATSDVQRAISEGRLAGAERAWDWVQRRAVGERRFDVVGTAVDVLKRVGALLAAQAGNLLQNVAVFRVRSRDHALCRVLPVPGRRRADAGRSAGRCRSEDAFKERLIRQTRELVSATVASAGIVAAVQGAARRPCCLRRSASTRRCSGAW